jgi:hypothetical protein
VKSLAPSRTIDVSNAPTTVLLLLQRNWQNCQSRHKRSDIQLAPNSTRGDSDYGSSNAPSIGGASASGK